MSSMKQIDKKRSPANNQIKRSTRVASRETKLQQERASITLRAKEANKIASSARVKSSIVVNDTKKSAKPSEVNDKLGAKPSMDLDNEVNDGREESDSDTVTDSVSSSGDSRATDHDLHNLQINTSPSISEKTKKSPNSLVKYSVGNNSKGLKVHPKPPSTPSSTSSEGFDDQDPGEPKEADILDEASNGVESVVSDDETLRNEENTGHEAKEALGLKIAQMEMRIEQLEDELREVAALEISLYSVVQEHGSSPHKVHTPAHRLSRLYIHAGNHLTQEKRTTIARNIVSGLIMISKSCGNDVPRLTFWWSNIIVLREIITQAFESSCFLSSELEKVESGMFTQIVESIWWQTLMPNMLSNERTGKLLGLGSGDQQQSNFSISLWQNAFHDAFKRLCPVRAGGSECDCLPMLARMVMEQCIARLDIGMFNAILREPAHEFPTNVAIDPITESRVLPIAAGDLSFGSGAQLKKAVGTWSRWLTDKFSADTESDHTDDEYDGLGKTRTGDLKCFRLLNSLSHLLMVPKDMLMDRSIRAEVCPSISLALFKRILCNFTPDELCPDPVPNTLLEAVNAESLNIMEGGSSEDDSISFPYAASRIIYKPPSSKKVCEASGYTSEAEEQASFIMEKLPAFPSKQRIGNARYQLLREVWSS